MLNDTGERVIPELMKPTNLSLLEHVARYYFSFPYVQGRVLDIACGVGYGIQLVAKQCKKQMNEAIGIDIDSDTLKYAKQKYHHPLITFQQGDVLDSNLPKKLGQFDTILSFETFEHIEDETRFLDNIYHMLKPGGTLVLSTPFGQGRGIPCGQPFHFHQITQHEFVQLFDSYDYSSVTLYGQKGVLVEPLLSNRKNHFPIGVAVCQK